ncbi:hypothetical protein D3C86_1533600 [compost metagenome]
MQAVARHDDARAASATQAGAEIHTVRQDGRETATPSAAAAPDFACVDEPGVRSGPQQAIATIAALDEVGMIRNDAVHGEESDRASAPSASADDHACIGGVAAGGCAGQDHGGSPVAPRGCRRAAVDRNHATGASAPANRKGSSPDRDAAVDKGGRPGATTVIDGATVCPAGASRPQGPTRVSGHT